MQILLHYQAANVIILIDLLYVLEMITLADDCNQIFAERFKELRVNSGYTQQQLANLFNVTRPCICYWETGKRVPDYTKLIEICRFFKVSSDYLLGFTNNKKPNLNDKRYEYNSDDIIDISKFSEKYKREIKEFVEYMSYKQEKDKSQTKY